MNDKELVEALRNYAASYMSGIPYSFNPGLALLIADRFEELTSKNFCKNEKCSCCKGIENEN